MNRITITTHNRNNGRILWLAHSATRPATGSYTATKRGYLIGECSFLPTGEVLINRQSYGRIPQGVNAVHEAARLVGLEGDYRILKK